MARRCLGDWQESWLALNGPILYAYIDETGDRGVGPKASEWFALVGVVIAAEDVPLERIIVNGMREEYNVPGPLHWVEHFKPKRPERRRHAALSMSGLPTKVAVAAAHKPCMSSATHSGMASDGTVFYNYAYRLLIERIAYIAREWPGGSRRVRVLADSVRGMDHEGTRHYLEYVRDYSSRYDRYRAPWEQVIWPPTWHSSQDFEGIQLADLHASSLGAALNRVDSQWFAPWADHVRAAGTSAVWSRGFKCLTGCAERCLPADLRVILGRT